MSVTEQFRLFVRYTRPDFFCILLYMFAAVQVGFVWRIWTMDRRQQKTRRAIFQAFNRLLEKKHFNNITVQEILDEADVGRSTFYSHFETKDALLKAMCTDIFDHIFSHELHSETSHDFSASDHGLQEKITHLLYHLKDNQSNVLGVLSGDSGELFMRYFKEYLAAMFEQYPEFDDRDDKFVENEQQWVEEIAHYIEEHIDRFAEIVHQ